MGDSLQHFWLVCSVAERCFGLGFAQAEVHRLLSTCEAEIIALSEAAKDVVYLRKLVKGLGSPEPSLRGGPPPLTESDFTGYGQPKRA